MLKCKFPLQLRDKLMRDITSISDSSKDNVIAPVIAMLAEVPEHFSPYSAQLGTTTILKMTGQLVKCNTNVLFGDFVWRSKNLVAASGMIVKATSISLDPNKYITNQWRNLEEVCNMVDSYLFSFIWLVVFSLKISVG